MSLAGLADDAAVVQRLLDHIDNGTTDLGDAAWREPVENYRCAERFAAEREGVLRRRPTVFCPSAALPSAGAYLAREAAGVPLLAVRGADGEVRVFRNACRHRGAQLGAGGGCAKAFVCRYHGWTYGLDGQLRHVPHAHGFPGLDARTRGLVPVQAVERQGLVFVLQEGGEPLPGPLDDLPRLVPAGHRVVGAEERELPVNWKIFLEGFLEGYHIRSTHAETFYPVQFDNLNVVERFGPNSRVAYPYRTVHAQRALSAKERSADGVLTYVYHLFPNAIVATFPGRIIAVVLEPLAIDRTRLHTWLLTDRELADGGSEAALRRGADLVDAGAAEDREVACAIQRGLASGANQSFEFGLFEAAIVHFHRTLRAALGES